MPLKFGVFLGENVWSGMTECTDTHVFCLNPKEYYRVALLIPMCGAAGLWGPSCIANAQLAVHELNEADGIDGKPVQVIVLDSAAEAEVPAEDQLHQLIEERSVDAVVGMHISAVREQLVKVIRGRIPFIYTPLYEGGETAKGVFAIGETPQKQLGPAVDYLNRRFRLKKWAMIGNDYVWPRASHKVIKQRMMTDGTELVHESYLPFNPENLEEEVERLAQSGADAVLVSLVGQDAVDFNRIFGSLDLHTRMVRLSGAMEENGLLASGEKNVERLFASSSYFGALNTPENLYFRERYRGLHQDRAPVLNSLGQSTYEGFHFLASLIEKSGRQPPRSPVFVKGPMTYKSVRGSTYIDNSSNTAPIYMARADGVVFDDIRRIH